MKSLLPLVLVFLVMICSCKNAIRSYESKDLQIERLSKSTFVHTSFLDSNNFGKISCNGMIAVDGREAIIFDTPIDNAVSNELIQWVENKLKCEIKALVVTHFHVDCLGGLEAFHEKGIPSYALDRTIELAKAEEVAVPKNGFSKVLNLPLGQQEVLCKFVGEGHTEDNVVGYVPGDRVLFGGCLIKSLGAGKGNLADANELEWANSVSKLKQTFPNTRIVIPGHGKPGGPDLLDYTIEKFQ